MGLNLRGRNVLKLFSFQQVGDKGPYLRPGAIWNSSRIANFNVGPIQLIWWPVIWPPRFRPQVLFRDSRGTKCRGTRISCGHPNNLEGLHHNLSSYQISSTQCPIFSESERPWYYLLRIWTAWDKDFTFALTNCMGGDWGAFKVLKLVDDGAGRFFANFQKLPSFVDQSLGPTKIPIAINSKKSSSSFEDRKKVAFVWCIPLYACHFSKKPKNKTIQIKCL